MREVNLIPLIKDQAKVLNQLNMILKFEKTNLINFFAALCGFE